MNTILVYNYTNNWYSSPGGNGFDLDGDVTVDTTTGAAANTGNFIVFYSIPSTVAQKVNNLIDGDTTTNANWASQGQVEYLNNNYLSIYLQGGR